MIRDEVEDQVVTFSALGEVLLCVINDSICTNGSNHIQIAGTAYARDMCTERLGDLHGERTHASCGTVYQNLLPWLNVPLIAKTLQCSERRYRNRSGLLKRDVLGLDDHS